MQSVNHRNSIDKNGVYGALTLDFSASRLRDELTILWFRRFLEGFGLTKIILAEVNTILQSKGLLLRSRTAIDAT
jgi:hypothetical protein